MENNKRLKKVYPKCNVTYMLGDQWLLLFIEKEGVVCGKVGIYEA